jgi:pimeloyl-ACP methyl ester carboxylesterase
MDDAILNDWARMEGASTAVINGVEIFYVDRGTGVPLVLLHGWSMSGRFFARQLKPLAARHRIIIPDLRGHGRSGKSFDGHTVDQYADDVTVLLQHLEVDRPVLVGWSMGVMVAYGVLQRQGMGAARGLVVAEQVPTDYRWPDYDFGVFDAETMYGMNKQLVHDQKGLATHFADAMVHAPNDESRAFMSSEMLLVPPAIASAILLDQTLRDDRGFIPTITVPTLVVFGADASLTDPEAGRWISSQIPGSRFVAIDEASHCPFYEQPERFNQLVSEFASSL